MDKVEALAGMMDVIVFQEKPKAAETSSLKKGD